jgi:DNA/RNA-binding domain of Phe-tRNA-synthetase-like protein
LSPPFDAVSIQRDNEPMHTPRIDAHPLLVAGLLETAFPAPLSELPSPTWLVELLKLDAPAPLASSDEVRAAVRDLLRHGGFKPTGRSKPAAEYLLRAASEGQLGSINLAVDLCNAVSLHTGLPISVVDLARASGELRIGVAPSGASYVFNAAGQSIDLGGLLCVHDAEGPCANAVKDAQRTKTGADTRTTLSVVWSSTALPGRLGDALRWYGELVERCGGRVVQCSEVAAPRS